jgi:hypothetical protein
LGEEAVEVQSEDYKGEAIGAPFVEYINAIHVFLLKLLLGSRDPLIEAWVLI